jgi:hypothetical protein
MQQLSENEAAVLELLAMAPVSCWSSRTKIWVRRLKRQGLAEQRDGTWFPTRAGLLQIGRAIH